MSIPSKNLGELVNSEAIPKRIVTITLDDAQETIKNFGRRRAYYIGNERRNLHLFGIVGNSSMFVIPHETYEGVGSPAEGQEIEIRHILEKTGYQPE